MNKGLLQLVLACASLCKSLYAKSSSLESSSSKSNSSLSTNNETSFDNQTTGEEPIITGAFVGWWWLSFVIIILVLAIAYFTICIVARKMKTSFFHVLFCDVCRETCCRKQPQSKITSGRRYTNKETDDPMCPDISLKASPIEKVKIRRSSTFRIKVKNQQHDYCKSVSDINSVKSQPTGLISEQPQSQSVMILQKMSFKIRGYRRRATYQPTNGHLDDQQEIKLEDIETAQATPVSSNHHFQGQSSSNTLLIQLQSSLGHTYDLQSHKVSKSSTGKKSVYQTKQPQVDNIQQRLKNPNNIKKLSRYLDPELSEDKADNI